ncbi:MAG: class I SAM-dependent methyltransferase [Planctomycetota bacterium]|nr:class I SAM-dependent methyltransferase [Planctomycetota bacterium]
MPTDLTLPDPAPVFELLEGFRRSKVLFAAVELGVFDALESGPIALGDLAQQLNCQQDTLGRLLDACVQNQLLTRDDAGYHNTPAAAMYLCQSSSRRMTGYIRYSNDVLWHLWAKLEHAVQEGTHRWKEVYGWDGPIFSHFFKTEESKREFLMGMHGYGCFSSPVVVSAFDLTPYQTLVDLGGATGHLAVAACERYPHMQAIVFDLPDATPLAREMVSATRVADRISVIFGDFFVDALPTADLFALGRIVHDWAEEKILRLLSRVYDRLPSGGAILIAEKLLWDDKTGPRWAQLQSLNMLVCTEGKERSLQEYAAILERVGFVDVRGVRTATPLDAVLATKP